MANDKKKKGYLQTEHLQKATSLMLQLSMVCREAGLTALIIVGEELTPQHLEAKVDCQGKHQKRLHEILKNHIS